MSRILQAFETSIDTDVSKNKFKSKVSEATPSSVPSQSREDLLKTLESLRDKFDPGYVYSKDYNYFRNQHDLSKQIQTIEAQIDQMSETMNEIGMIRPTPSIQPLAPPKPGIPQKIDPVSSTANVQPGTQTLDPKAQAADFSDTLKQIMSNSGLKSEFEKLLAKVK